MITYIITKIINKYKLYLSLVLGIIAIVMVFSMMMMFKDGSDRKLIQKGFVEQREETGIYPAGLMREELIPERDLAGLSASEKLTERADALLDATETAWNGTLKIPEIMNQRVVYYRNLEAEFSFRGSGRVELGYLDSAHPESLLEHCVIRDGVEIGEDISAYREAGVPIPEDAIGCYVSKALADEKDLVPGEILNFWKLSYEEQPLEKPRLVLYISGIISEKDGDYFWGKTLGELENFVILEKDDFEEFAHAHPKEVTMFQYSCYDYRAITTQNVDALDRGLSRLTKEQEGLTENISGVIRGFREGRKSVNQMLYVIILPLIVLVLVFIGMISRRIIDSERGELTTLKNRGLGRGRLILLYLLQSVLLAAVSFVPGVALGWLFGRTVASVDDFMGFSFGENSVSVLDYQFNRMMIAAGAVGALISVIMMMIPVLMFFRSGRSRRKSVVTPSWEKYFVDVILLAVSCYLLFNYNKQLSSLSEGVLNGEGIDPVIFINSTLFLFACGLLMLRLIFYLVKLVFKIGEKRFGPVTYSGLLQIMRTRKTSGVISIFLVMTVAMSVFNAGLARTINANKEERAKYEIGGDLRIREHWDIALVKRNDSYDWKYREPDYAAYQKLVDEGSFESATKVTLYDRVLLSANKESQAKTLLMGISTKEFGETASLPDGLTEKHWYHYLNALAKTPDGVVISRNMADFYDLKEDSRLILKVLPPKVTGSSEPFATAEMKVVAITDAWPGFNQYDYIRDENGKITAKEHFLVVMNEATMTNSFAKLPYEVWAKTDLMKEETEEKLKENFGTNKRYIEEIGSWRDEQKHDKNSAIMQITNGIFTADFLVALILCIIGYMIYWITSIRDRELLFGIYRAMGITKGEINRMVGLEQIFLSVMSIFAGAFAGILALFLFIRVFAAVYLPELHNVPIFLATSAKDYLEIGVVLLAVVVLSAIWIRRIVKKLNITEALKLGED